MGTADSGDGLDCLCLGRLLEMVVAKTYGGMRIDPYPHGLQMMVVQEGSDEQEDSRARERERRVNLAVRLVACSLRQMAASDAWSRSRKKKTAALALAAIIANPDELRPFMRAVFNERDSKLVDVWVASYLKDRHGVEVSNVTVNTLLTELEARIDELVEKGRVYVQQ